MGFWNTVQRIQDKTRPLCSMIVAAAGSSTRMGGQDKMFARLGGAPVLMRTICAIDQAELVSEIVVAASEENLEEVAALRPPEKSEGGQGRREPHGIGAVGGAGMRPQGGADRHS